MPPPLISLGASEAGHGAETLPSASRAHGEVAAPLPATAAGTRVSPSLHWSTRDGLEVATEILAEEAPLALELVYERAGQRVRKVVAITMRTPGHDEELALGFFFGEGLIKSTEDVARSGPAAENARGEKLDTWVLELRRAPADDLRRMSRGLVTSSACGLCGRVSLEGLAAPAISNLHGARPIALAALAGLPEKLRLAQDIFAVSGGSHGAGLFAADGTLYLAREDVGRHNAVDKLVGAALRERLSRDGKILVLSGRASFELLQKAAAAGLGIVAAVGAPSSLAVQLAHRAGITLVGFARGDRCNIYTHAGRLDLGPGRRGPGG